MHRDLLRSVRISLASLRLLKPDLTKVTFAFGVLRFASLATPCVETFLEFSLRMIREVTKPKSVFYVLTEVHRMKTYKLGNQRLPKSVEEYLQKQTACITEMRSPEYHD